MKIKLLLKVLITLGCLAVISANAFADQVNVYSESSTDSRTNNPVAFNRLLWQFSNYHFLDLAGNAYVGTGFSKDGRTKGDVIFNDNYAFISTGLNLSLTNNLNAFVEYRNVVDELGRETSKSKNDFRTGLTFFHRQDLAESPVFHEHYSELIFSNRQLQNTFWMGRSRLGYNKNISGPFFAEAMLQGKGKLDRIGHYYENLVEAGPALRLRFLKRNYSLDLMGGYVMGRYLGREDIDPAPVDLAYNNWQALLVFSGSF